MLFYSLLIVELSETVFVREQIGPASCTTVERLKVGSLGDCINNADIERRYVKLEP